MPEQETKDYKMVSAIINAEHVGALNAATNAMAIAITEGDRTARLTVAASMVNVLQDAIRLDGFRIDNLIEHARNMRREQNARTD